MSELRALFNALGQGQAAQPAQTVTDFPGGGGDFITYLGAIQAAGVFGAKLSPYIVTDGAPIIAAWTHLMSMTTGAPLALVDAMQLTTERTAGTTALAVDLLAPATATRLAIIGAGPVAQAHLRHVLGLREWTSVQVFSPSLVADIDQQSLWQGISSTVTVAPDAAIAIAGADVLMLCTSSGRPVIDTASLKSSTLVTSISTNAPNAHEVPPAFLTAAEVYCDYAPTTPAAAAEMRLAGQYHGWSADNLRGDLAELTCGTCPMPTGARPAYFRSVGLGLEDVAMAYGIWKLATGETA